VAPADVAAVELAEGDRALVILDNCEHLIEECAEFVVIVLAASSDVTILATSREQLGVAGEVAWRVPSLLSPPRGALLPVQALSQYDAVNLFVDRARRARPSFSVNDANAAAVAQICHRLDGIPLAVELAAARCRHLSAEQIATQLDDRFRLLTGGSRTVMPRQQTLSASIDWSYDLLDDLERRVLQRLGVFAGPFSLLAAEAVVATFGDVDAITHLETLDDRGVCGVQQPARVGHPVRSNEATGGKTDAIVAAGPKQFGYDPVRRPLAHDVADDVAEPQDAVWPPQRSFGERKATGHLFNL
jgi:predicted ATPase